MKIKIFSHKSDPDGIGSVIVCSLVYANLDFELFTNNRELDIRLKEFIDNKEYTNYDKIFITDLCPNNELLRSMASLKVNPFLVYDHHVTSFNTTNTYSFVHIDNTKKECATSILYNALKENINNKTIANLVELTRLHDTWLWKSEGQTKAFDLEKIYHYLGAYGYYYYFKDKCLKEDNVFFNKEEERYLASQTDEEQKCVKSILERIIIKKVDGLVYATVYGPYLLRNLVADSIRDKYDNVDVLVYLTPDNGTISFRTISGVSVNELAENLGGGGHASAASAYLSLETESFVRKRFL